MNNGSEQHATAIIGGEEWDVVHTYSRAQALEDGVLVAFDEDLSKQCFKWPVAMTQGVLALLSPNEDETAAGQSLRGRAWDLLFMTKYAARKHGNKSEIPVEFLLYFSAQREPVGKVEERHGKRGSGGRTELVTLKSVCGPDDDGSPCITIMLPEED